MSKVRGRSQEDPTPEGWWPRGVTPRLRSGAAAESSRLRRCRNGQEELPKSEVRGGGREEIPREQGQGRQPKVTTHNEEWWLKGHRRAERSYSTFNVRRGGGEEIPLVQGKEQRLRFAGAAMKRYTTSKIREPQVRW